MNHPNEPGKLSRRQFTTGIACAAAASSVLADDSTPLPPGASVTKNEMCVFTKPFNSLRFSQLADAIAELGFDGLEAPVRRGGHVAPADVKEGLPKLVAALRQRDLDITVMASDVNDPDDPVSRTVLEVAADQGIQRYRLAYFQYDLKADVQQQLDAWKRQLEKLADLNAKLGIRGLYQNHAGYRYFGGPLWDLREVLRDIDPKWLAVAYDIRHATVEGGTSWPTTFQMIRPHVDTVYVKDFDWQDGKVVNVPLGEGLVNPSFFKMLAESGFDGPISLHEEYLDHADPQLVPDHLAAIGRDRKRLTQWLQDARA